MSRLKFDTIEREKNTIGITDSDLDALINQYAENKSELDSYKKICENENNKIKDTMLELGLKTYSTEKYSVTRSVSVKETFDEEKLMNFIKTVLWKDSENGSMPCPYIKIKYVVDYDVLEKAIYNGEISKEQLVEMDKCKDVKETVTLRLTKKKGEK